MQDEQDWQEAVGQNTSWEVISSIWAASQGRYADRARDQSRNIEDTRAWQLAQATGLLPVRLIWIVMRVVVTQPRRGTRFTH